MQLEHRFGAIVYTLNIFLSRVSYIHHFVCRFSFVFVGIFFLFWLFTIVVVIPVVCVNFFISRFAHNFILCNLIAPKERAKQFWTVLFFGKKNQPNISDNECLHWIKFVRWLNGKWNAPRDIYRQTKQLGETSFVTARQRKCVYVPCWRLNSDWICDVCWTSSAAKTDTESAAAEWTATA